MAIPALDTTIGGANANSYVAMDEAENYLDSRLNSAVWSNATSDDKARALLMAAARLDRENWLGSRATTTQKLAWPRLYVAKIDSVADFYGGFYSYSWGWGYGEQYRSDEIPQQVKDAQCELALAYLDGFDDGAQAEVQSFVADGLSVTYASQRPRASLPPRVSQLISGLVTGLRLVRA